MNAASQIIWEVAQAHGVELDDLRSPRRSKKLVLARVAVAQRLKAERNLGNGVIGRMIGRSCWQIYYYLNEGFREVRKGNCIRRSRIWHARRKERR